MKLTFHVPFAGRVHLFLVRDWHAILLRAWSMRLMYLAFAFQVFEGLLPYIDEGSFGIPHGLFTFLTMTILIGAAWARVTPQPQTLAPPEKTDAN
ncbi:hypothetical protein [Mesorhizobium sp. INR15]|uniref:DUF7940 domain-containing protein n=1 Tax=Mesorhizobium sp. INR15 TaxID=2654248 RepID=UPI0018967AD9|nr:hypothetical protein [Mesorhizobium sp. INR15]QPC91462.1 hypothetical protein GA829_13045 [Mesorhizobium sp. INR15]